jgi:hypothetical protein
MELPLFCVGVKKTVANESTRYRFMFRMKKISLPNYVYIYIYIFPVEPDFGHRASVKNFVSLQFLNPKIIDRTPWTGDQPVARPLPIQTHKNTNIHAFSGIRNHNLSVGKGEDSSCLRPRGHCDRQITYQVA